MTSAVQSNSPSADLYIGLMCGTSIDGVDVALVDISAGHCKLVDSYLHPIPQEIKKSLRSLCSLADGESSVDNNENRIELMGQLDVQMGQVFAEAVSAFLKLKKIGANQITAIGSHGQTIRHQPHKKFPFSLQIGDANIIAHLTGITTVADFRRMDIAAGGQGAPLAPAFHNAVMRSADENRIILNLGGIANITLLPKETGSQVIGFDTGTANTLLDAWFMKHHPEHDDDFDRDAAIAKQGSINQALLDKMLADPYFSLPYPKSTGREYFSLDWLENKIQSTAESISPEDVQRSLLEFSAITIADAIKSLLMENFNVYGCGGGVHNAFLLTRINHHLGQTVFTTDKLGVSGDYMEAMTFAWLAHQRIKQLPGNLPSVTGAKASKILGAVYYP